MQTQTQAQNNVTFLNEDEGQYHFTFITQPNFENATETGKMESLFGGER
jgi:hypothetical protein